MIVEFTNDEIEVVIDAILEYEANRCYGDIDEYVAIRYKKLANNELFIRMKKESLTKRLYNINTALKKIKGER